MNRKLCAALAALMMLAIPAKAEQSGPITAGLLSDICQVDRKFCSTYVMGVFEGMRMANDQDIKCVPSSLNYNTMTDMVVGGLQELKPKAKGEFAVVIVATIIATSFPCKKHGAD